MRIEHRFSITIDPKVPNISTVSNAIANACNSVPFHGISHGRTPFMTEVFPYYGDIHNYQIRCNDFSIGAYESDPLLTEWMDMYFDGEHDNLDTINVDLIRVHPDEKIGRSEFKRLYAVLRMDAPKKKFHHYVEMTQEEFQSYLEAQNG